MISTFFCEIRSVKLLNKKKENYFLDSSIIIVWCLSTSRYFSFIVMWDIHNLCNVVMYVKWRHRLDNVAEIEKK